MKRFRPWLWLLLFIPAAIGLTRLRFDVEVLNLLPRNSTVVEGLRLYQQNFSNGQELLVTLESSDPALAEESARNIALQLRKQTNLVSQITWQPPWLENPAQGAELIAYLWFNQPPHLFAMLTNRLQGAELTNTLLDAREQLSSSLSPEAIALRGYDPLSLTTLPEAATAGAQSFGSGNQFFASPDGTFRIVFVEPAYELKNYRQADEWLTEIKKNIASAIPEEAADEVQVSYTGRPAFVTEIATGMQQDIRGSVIGTMIIIAALFWIAHRRIRPLLCLLLLLTLVLVGALGFGGLFFGTLNVVSLGFAAILLGLAVDYGLVLFQEARVSQAPIEKVLRAVAPSIIWSAITTAAAFAVLNFSGLPGLGQLGTMVAVGVLLSAIIMLSAFLPLLQRAKLIIPVTNTPTATKISAQSTPRRMLLITFIAIAVALVLLFRHMPGFDHSSEALRPKTSPAYTTLDKIKEALGQSQEPLWIVVSGTNEQQVATRLGKAEHFLQEAAAQNLVSNYTLATPLWPKPQYQNANRATVEELLRSKTNAFAATLAQGFTPDSLRLADNMFQVWQRAASATNVFWPTNIASRWTMNQLAAHRDGTFYALGLVYPNYPAGESAYVAGQRLLKAWPNELTRNGVILSGWTVLGAAVFDLVEHDLPRVILPMFFLLLISLGIAFRSWKPVFLSFAALAFAGLCVLAIMSVTGQSWNLMNMMAIPLLLGAGVDYSIHMQDALRRHHGDLAAVRRSIGRALWLCGGTTIVGFGSLAFSSNAGMASLGLVCAFGITANLLVALYLLPSWWRALHRSSTTA